MDPDFGTGALKITPAHDHTDHAVGKRHGLEVINILNADGSINAAGGARYKGMDRFDARLAVWKELQERGLAIESKHHTSRVPRSQRGGGVVEPRVSTQWFVKMSGMAGNGLKALDRGDMDIVPQRFEKTYRGWLEGIEDWCVSRQLWWGHRIPVWYVVEGERPVSAARNEESGESGEESGVVGGGDEDGSGSTPLPIVFDTDTPFVVARDTAEAHEKAAVMRAEVLGAGAADAAPYYLEQENDVLDTWFSSALWPFSTLGWPSTHDSTHGSTHAAASSSIPSSDYDRFYPTSLMETGYDIIFFWVARMAMVGLELTGKTPFKTVYLHGLVRDEEGRKMSKTTGNVIDPLEVTAEYGADALRYALVTGSTPGQDVSLSMERIKTNSHFVNKLWNIGRLVCQHAPAQPRTPSASTSSTSASSSSSSSPSVPVMPTQPPTKLALPERYIITRCHQVAEEVTELLDDPTKAGIGQAGRLVHDFIWHEFADWYVEISKERLWTATDGADGEKSSDGAAAASLAAKETLAYVYGTCLQLLHPYMPFATEMLWWKLQCALSCLDESPENEPNLPLPPPTADGGSAQAHMTMLAVAPWPVPLAEGNGDKDGHAGGSAGLFVDVEAVAGFRVLQEVVNAVRSVRAEHKVTLSQPLRHVLIAVDCDKSGAAGDTDAAQQEALLAALDGECTAIAGLMRSSADGTSVCRSTASNTSYPEWVDGNDTVQVAVSSGVVVYVCLEGMVDLKKEIARLEKQREKLLKSIGSLDKRLSSGGFVKSAKPEVVEATRESRAEQKETLAAVEMTLIELHARQIGAAV